MFGIVVVTPENVKYFEPWGAKFKSPPSSRKMYTGFSSAISPGASGGKTVLPHLHCCCGASVNPSSQTSLLADSFGVQMDPVAHTTLPRTVTDGTNMSER